MPRYVFDIEANGLLDEATRIWCIVLYDIDSKETHSYDVVNVEKGINKIQEASLLIGHNIICYDVPVLEKIFGIKITAKLLDTLLLYRMVWPDIGMTADIKKKYHIPGELFGSYSLEAFGYRVGLPIKIENEDWSQWTPTMQKRCEHDVEINTKLYKTIADKMPSDKSIYIETEFQKFIHLQERLGVYFDEEKALALQAPLENRIQAITNELQRIIPPKEIKLKRSVKYHDFNPGSRQQIIEFLCQKYNWKPEKFTKKGNPELSEDVLEGMIYPEAQLFSEYFKTQKLLGMLSDGENSWLKYVKNGKIHGRVITLGAVTGRCTHSSPNLAQIPSIRAFMGKEVRSLFYAPAGYKMIGTDASGLELRCFSHYLFNFDQGIYANEVIHGDVHTRNMYAAGLDKRDDAKTFIYALLYGAGDPKIGAIKVPRGTIDEQRAAGRVMRYSFMEKVPAYKELTRKIKMKIQLGDRMHGIDGRVLTIRHEHAALNTLLQNAGAVAMKLAAVIMRDDLIQAGIEPLPCLNIHDEVQMYGLEKDVEEIKRISIEAIRKAGEELNFKCALAGEAKSGQTWQETH